MLIKKQPCKLYPMFRSSLATEEIVHQPAWTTGDPVFKESSMDLTEGAGIPTKEETFTYINGRIQLLPQR